MEWVSRPGTGEPFDLGKAAKSLYDVDVEGELSKAVSDSVPVIRTTYRYTREIFLRFLSLIFFIAFASFFVQIPGLIGSSGLQPAAVYLQIADLSGSPVAWASGWDARSLDFLLDIVCLMGMGASIAGVLGYCNVFIMLALCWYPYLCLVVLGQTFLSFEADSLLLEVGFIAAFWASPFGFIIGDKSRPSTIVLLLLRFVLFKFLIMSGVAKIESSDASWRDLSALQHYYTTQSLPTPASWYLSRIPDVLHPLGAAAILILELPCAFLALSPFRAVRHGYAAALVGLQAVLALSGNHGFFNLLVICLSLTLLDDSAWRSLLDADDAWADGAAPPPAAGRRGESTPLIHLTSAAAAAPARGYGTPDDDGAAAAAARLAYIGLVVMRVVCPVCMVSHVINGCLLYVAWAYSNSLHDAPF